MSKYNFSHLGSGPKYSFSHLGIDEDALTEADRRALRRIDEYGAGRDEVMSPLLSAASSENVPVYTGNAVLQSPAAQPFDLTAALNEKMYGIPQEPVNINLGYDSTLGDVVAGAAIDFGRSASGFASGAGNALMGGLRGEIGGGLEFLADSYRDFTSGTDLDQLPPNPFYQEPVSPLLESRQVESDQAYRSRRDDRVQRAEDQLGGVRELTDILSLQADENRRAVAENRPDDALGGWTYDLTTSLAQMAPALAVSSVTKSPNAGLAQMFAQVFGNEYQQGAPATESALRAGFEVVPEKMFGVFERFLNPQSMNRLKQSLAEGGTEIVTEALNQGYDAMKAGGYDGSYSDLVAELLYAGSLGAGMGAVIGPSGPQELQPPPTPNAEPQPSQSTFINSGNIAEFLSGGLNLSGASSSPAPQSIQADGASNVWGAESFGAMPGQSAETAIKPVLQPSPISNQPAQMDQDQRRLRELLAREFPEDVQGDAPSAEAAPTQAPVSRETAQETQAIERPSQTAPVIEREQLPIVRLKDGGSREWPDMRLRRPEFRNELQGMVGELRKGGGSMGRVNTNDGSRPSDPSDWVGVPSENPAWARSLIEDGMTVERIRNAVNKALQGKPLGERQAEVVERMIDQISAGRMNADFDRGFGPETVSERLAPWRDQLRARRGELTDAQVEQLAYETDQVRKRGEFVIEPDMPMANNQTERRTTPDQRAEIAAKDPYEMTSEERLIALLSNELTGINGRRAFNRAVESHQGEVVSIDADNLKWINDNLSPSAGDSLLTTVARSLHKTFGDRGSFHTSGDEFYILPQEGQNIDSLMAQVNDTLSRAELEVKKKDGTVIVKRGLNITFGRGATKDAADESLKAEKRRREATGERAGREQEPGGVERIAPRVSGSDRAGGQVDDQAAARAEGADPKQDLAGPVDRTAQAQSDAERERQRRADQSPDMVEGDGDLFGGPRPVQGDLVGEREVEPLTESKPNQETESPTITEPEADSEGVDGGLDQETTPEVIEAYGDEDVDLRRAQDKQASLNRELTDDDIARMPLSKIWPKKEVDAIENDTIAAFMMAVRSHVPAKPRRTYEKRKWVEKVKAVRTLGQKYMENPKRVRDGMSGNRALEPVMNQADLMAQLPREYWGSIGKVNFYPDSYRFEKDGSKTPSPHASVDINKRTRAFEGVLTVDDLVNPVQEILAGQKAPSLPKFRTEIRYSPTTERAFIVKKGDSEYRHLKDFDSVDAAREYLKGDNQSALEKAWEDIKARDNVKKADVRRDQNRDRQGKDFRGDRNISSKEFGDTFGLRKVDFGEWVKQGNDVQSRQGSLNEAYDALMDLSDILGIPPKAIGLNGDLIVTFGKRGKGWAAAHFEPSMQVINLTKTKGAGSLAHEWFHALDNYFQRQRGTGNSRETSYVSYRPERLMRNKKHPSMTATRIELQQRREAHPSAAIYQSDQWELDPNHPEGVRPEVESRLADLVAALNESPMRGRAEKIDKGREGYWSRIIERAARSFENYVIYKMGEQGYSNDYLANVQQIESFARDVGRYPYLKADEIQPVAEAFDNLFETIETRETDSGVEMYRRESGGRQRPEAPREPITIGTPAKRRLDRLSASLNADLRPVATPGSQQQTAERLSDLFGVEVIFVDGADGWDGVNVSAREIFISVDAVNPYQQVIGHELTHALRRDNPALYDRLVKELTPLVKDMAERESAVRRRAQGEDLADESRVQEEVTADLMGEMLLSNPEILSDMRPSLARQVIQYIRDFFRRILRGKSTDTYSDLFAAKEAAQQALRGWADATADQRTERIGEFAPAFQRSFGGNETDQTQTEAFQKWFGDSKVVGENGEPLVVYHGTKEEFTQFDPDRAIGTQFWFTNDRGAIERGEVGAQGKGVIMDVFLSIKNPAGWAEYDKFGIDEMIGRGHDGMILPEKDGTATYVAFNPEQIKSATGNVGTFDPENPDIRYSRAEATEAPTFQDFALTDREYRETYLDPANDTLAARLKERGRVAARRGRIVFQDALLPVKEAVEQAREKGTVREFTDVYKRAENMIGKTGDMLERMEERHIMPLVDKMREWGVSQDQLGEYLYARHAKERNAQIAKINDKFADAEKTPGSGMPDSEADKILNGYDDKTARRMEQLAKRVDAITAATKKTLVDSGLIDKEMADAWDQTYQNYVPLKGIDSDVVAMESIGRGFDTRGVETRRALGRRSLAKDVLANVIVDAQRAVIRSQKNDVGQSLLMLALENPNPNLWTVSPVKSDRRIDPATGKVVDFQSADTFGDDVFKVKVDGQVWSIKLDPQLARSMKNLGASHMNMGLRMTAKLNRWLSYANTALNPEFVITNFFRDFTQSLVQLQGEQGAEMAKNIAKDVLGLGPAMGALHEISGDGAFSRKLTEALGKDKTREWSKWFERYRETGGKISYFRQESIPEQVARINNLMAMGERTAPAMTRRAFKATIDLIENLNGAVENAVRVATFKNAIESGMTETDAAHMSRDLTVNFNRRGEAGVMLNSLYLFYNASIQGTARVLMAMKHKRVRQAIGYGMAANAAITIMNYMLAGEDDDGENRYEKIPDYEKARNIIIMTPGGEPVKIPLPYVFNAFMSVPENLVGIAFGRDPHKATANIASTFINSMNPIGDESFLNVFTPTILDPVVSLERNMTFFGQQVMPENPYEDYTRPDSDRYWASVNPLALKVAKSLNRISGGSDTTSGYFDVSPESLEYLYDHFTGAAGAFVNRMITFGADPATAFEENKAPLLRKLYGANTTFYAQDQYNAAKERLEAIQEAQERIQREEFGSYDEWQETMRDFNEENSREIDLLRPYQQTDRRIRRLFDRRSDILGNDRLTNEEKEERIEGLMEEIDKVRARFLQQYNETFYFTGLG